MLFQVLLEVLLALFKVVQAAVDAVEIGSVFGVVLFDRGTREMVRLMREGVERRGMREGG